MIPKFRAWLCSANKMFYEQDFVRASFNPFGITLRHGSFVTNCIMQAIGSRDLKNLEIYDGDIIKFRLHNVLTTGEIFYNNDAAAWYVRFHYPTLDDIETRLISQGITDIEVIGNIFEGEK